MPENTVHDADHSIAPETPDSGQMPLVGHLEELRRRLIIALIAIGISSIASYFYAQDIVHVLTAPAGKLYYISPAEAFFSYMKVAVFVGFLISLPVTLYQVWAFVVPALTRNEHAAMGFLMPVSLVLFFIGLAFSYYLVFPAAVQFFLGFASDDLQPMITLGQYLSFVISMLLPFGFVFELPLFILVLAKAGIISSAFLIGKRKIVLVMAFVVGAIVSPTPDIFSQTMIAVPMLLLYELSIVIVKYILHK